MRRFAPLLAALAFAGCGEAAPVPSKSQFDIVPVADRDNPRAMSEWARMTCSGTKVGALADALGVKANQSAVIDELVRRVPNRSKPGVLHGCEQGFADPDVVQGDVPPGTW